MGQRGPTLHPEEAEKMAGRLPLCPADVGRRVSVRSVDQDGHARDSVGRLAVVTPSEIAIERRDGTRAVLDPRTVVAARVVPPEVGALELQRIAELGWPPLEGHSLGAWRLRWSGGTSQRRDSVRIGGDPGMPLDDALAAVGRWYASRGARPLLQVPSPWLDDDLAARDWHLVRSVLALHAPLAGDSPPAGPPGVCLVHMGTPSEEWRATLGDEGAALPVMPREGTTHVAAVDGSGTIVATGRGSLDGDWCGITCIATAPAHRGRGVATVVTREVMAWGRRAGASRSYLQVLESNATARRLYERMGFALHHRYGYWAPAS